MEYKINEEFRKFLPPLPAEDYEELKKSIKEGGLRADSIIVWAETDEIVDGHHRYQACQELGIEVEQKHVIPISFEDDIAVLTFMVREQEGRRNMDLEEIAYCHGIIYEMNKKDQATQNKGNRFTKVAGGHSDHPLKTAKTIAKDCGKDERTVRRNGEYVRALKAIDEALGDNAGDKLRKKLPIKTIVGIAKADDIAEAYKEALKAKANPKPKAKPAPKPEPVVEPEPTPEPEPIAFNIPEETEYDRGYIDGMGWWMERSGGMLLTPEECTVMKSIMRKAAKDYHPDAKGPEADKAPLFMAINEKINKLMIYSKEDK